MFNFRERENHTTHLKNIEAELDLQVAKVESAARERAKRDYEDEKRQLQSKMEEEMNNMQTQLKIFQKVRLLFPRKSIISTQNLIPLQIDTYLNKEKEESTSQEALKKLENVSTF